MASDRMFGMEVEYGVAVVPAAGGGTPPRGTANGVLLEIASKRLACLPGAQDGGLFLANGSRLYLDTGEHIEMCTPETPDPWELVRYIKAGDRIMRHLADQVEAQFPAARIKLLRCNVDYTDRATSWGHHESYMHRASPTRLHDALLPHLVTRIIYCGSGGLHPLHKGIQFTISPRAWHLRSAVSGDTTSDRGILNTRNESLCGNGWRRLHLICGDGLCSEASLWLQVATTALVVALVEHGMGPENLELLDPVVALHSYTANAGLDERASLTNGQRATALEVQRAFLAAAEAARDHPMMPPWIDEACERWRAVLDALESGPDDFAGGVEWRIKRALYRAHCLDSGLPQAELRFWNETLQRRGKRLRNELCQGRRIGLCAEDVDGNAALHARLDKLVPDVQAAGYRWPGLARFLRLRAQLYELDLRWGEIGPEGGFEALARAGLLPDGASGIDGVEEAINSPPRRGRGRLRGKAIRLLAGQKNSWAAWSTVYDGERNAQLDLTDPFASRENWIDGPATDRLAEMASRRIVQRTLAGLRRRREA